MLSVGATGMDDNGIIAAIAGYYSHPEGRMLAYITDSYGFVNGY